MSVRLKVQIRYWMDHFSQLFVEKLYRCLNRLKVNTRRLGLAHLKKECFQFSLQMHSFVLNDRHLRSVFCLMNAEHEINYLQMKK